MIGLPPCRLGACLRDGGPVRYPASVLLGHRDGEALALGELMPRSAWAMMTMIDVTDLTGTFTEAPIVTAGALVDDLDGCIPAVRARVQRWAARNGRAIASGKGCFLTPGIDGVIAASICT